MRNGRRTATVLVEPTGSEKRAAEGDSRRRIEIHKGRMAQVVDHAERALVDSEANVYVRGGELVRVVESMALPIGRKNTIKRAHGAPMIAAHTVVSLADCLNRVALFLRFDQRDRHWKSADCPKEVAETLLSRVGMWQFRPLTAVISAPTLRPDGTILSEAGYDQATGFLLIEGMDLPAIPEEPTLRDAEEALATLDGLLEEFPFEGGTDRSATLAMLLTAIVRPSLPTAPLFAITAPTPGTGKSYLADLAAVLATGRRAAVVGGSCDEDELDKRLGASLMAGDTILNLDNLDRPLKSERLCQVLTQEVVKFRILGRSTNIDTPTKALMIATGNALRVHGDLTRRALLIRLDAGQERPETRKFKRDPVQVAIIDRPKYVAAALSILRAFIVSGESVGSPSLGSFTEWSNWVRSALVWLCRPDPVGAMEKARGTDPERERTSEILAALLPEGTWTVKELSRRLAPDVSINLNLRDALASFLKHNQFDRHGFGNWCAKHQNRPVSGMRLVEAGVDAKAKVRRWRVESVHQDHDGLSLKSVAGTAGTRGDSFPLRTVSMTK